MATPERFRRVPQFYSAFFFSLLSSCVLAASTSVAITWPYSLTRLGSIRYIQRCNPPTISSGTRALQILLAWYKKIKNTTSSRKHAKR